MFEQSGVMKCLAWWSRPGIVSVPAVDCDILPGRKTRILAKLII